MNHTPARHNYAAARGNLNEPRRTIKLPQGTLGSREVARLTGLSIRRLQWLREQRLVTFSGPPERSKYARMKVPKACYDEQEILAAALYRKLGEFGRPPRIRPAVKEILKLET